MVGATGFEPATSSPRTTRATKLRHAPTGSEPVGVCPLPGLPSSESFATRAADRQTSAGREGRLLYQRGAGADHPVHPFLPETAYLKTQILALD